VSKTKLAVLNVWLAARSGSSPKRQHASEPVVGCLRYW